MKVRKFTIYGCTLLAFALIASAGLSLASNDLHEGTANMTALGCVGCEDGSNCQGPQADTCTKYCAWCPIPCSGASGWSCGSGSYDRCEDGSHDCGSVVQKTCWPIIIGNSCMGICQVPSYPQDCGSSGWCAAYTP